jgi:hypothetical protein
MCRLKGDYSIFGKSLDVPVCMHSFTFTFSLYRLYIVARIYFHFLPSTKTKVNCLILFCKSAISVCNFVFLQDMCIL